MSFLAKEAEHVDGFAKECAVVTHHRLTTSPDGTGLIPDPDAKLEEPLIVRPTSETVIWNMFGKWINSYRDLPLKINQWANVVRWEMRTRPFLRSAEFLWQEGHTAHATAADAVETSREILDMYASVCEDMLAIPTIKGLKSPAERFAGADDTYTIEALMQNGWALQSGTSHFLGLNFARAFDVFFQTETGSRELVWATSWGVSTRLVGAMVMSHSDDKGLVLPPPVAPVQVIIVPITKGSGDDHDLVTAKVKELAAVLKAAKIRVKVDDRLNVRPGAKYFEWERKGVPVRLEIGPRDLSSSVAQMALRHTGLKSTIPLDNTDIVSTVRATLETMHKELLTAAQQRLSEGTYTVSTYADMKLMVQQSNRKDSENENEVELSDDKIEVRKAGFYLVPWKCDRSKFSCLL
jgi:prolyl-tRNA synthetase